MDGVVNLLSIFKKFAGRGGGDSISDNKIQLCAVTISNHPVIDREQRIAEDALPLPAKLTTFIPVAKIFHEDDCRFADLQKLRIP